MVICILCLRGLKKLKSIHGLCSYLESWLGKKHLSKLTQVFDRIQLLVVVGLKFLFFSSLFGQRLFSSPIGHLPVHDTWSSSQQGNLFLNGQRKQFLCLQGKTLSCSKRACLIRQDLARIIFLLIGLKHLSADLIMSANLFTSAC